MSAGAKRGRDYSYFWRQGKRVLMRRDDKVTEICCPFSIYLAPRPLECGTVRILTRQQIVSENYYTTRVGMKKNFGEGTAFSHVCVRLFAFDST